MGRIWAELRRIEALANTALVTARGTATGAALMSQGSIPETEQAAEATPPVDQPEVEK